MVPNPICPGCHSISGFKLHIRARLQIRRYRDIRAHDYGKSGEKERACSIIRIYSVLFAIEFIQSYTNEGKLIRERDVLFFESEKESEVQNEINNVFQV